MVNVINSPGKPVVKGSIELLSAPHHVSEYQPMAPTISLSFVGEASRQLLQHPTGWGFRPTSNNAGKISEISVVKAPYESGIKKGFPENAKEWIATGGKRCTDPITHAWLFAKKTPMRMLPRPPAALI